MVMDCPHCESHIDTLKRTGDKRYACADCSMVIAYDDVRDNLEEMEVIDKRKQAKTTADDDSNNSSQQKSQNINQNTKQQSNTGGRGSRTDREVIYQEGDQGLKRIKKERLKEWLSQTDGVGPQTEQRILMVFSRNDSVHKNPHVLYNLLDDELSASASYVNTMVEDVFSPENEHADLLQNQGYTPWFKRGAQGSPQAQGASFANQMSAPQSSGFSGGQQRQQQQQQQNRQQQSNGGGGDDSLSRQEAEMMMSQALSQADDQNQRGALLDGLSDATDEALREMAGNVGGLAGTIQKVFDEALVEYAKRNPELVIENMDILQKILGAAEDVDPEDEKQGQHQAEQDAKVDSALEGLSGLGNEPSGEQQGNQQQASQSVNRSPEPTQQQQPVEKSQDPNPDLNDDHLTESDFEPQSPPTEIGVETSQEEPDTVTEEDTQDSSPDVTQEDSDDETEEDDVRPAPKPTPGGDAAEISEEKRKQFESEESDTDDTEEDDSSTTSGFDDIFGDMET